MLRVDQYRFCVLKNIVIASTTALYSLGISASGGVHDHGAAELFLSAEGKTLQIRLNLPAMSVVGFETIAITDAQREAVNDAQTTLHDPSQLFSLQGKACELILAEVDVASVLEAGNTPSKPSAHAASDNHHDDHDDHDDHAGHDHSGVDPHFFTDPIQMIEVVEGLTEFLIEKISDIDADLVRSNAESYIGELEELHSEISALFSEIPTSKRVLVTNHQVFGYFAEQYGFEVVGTVIPSSSTLDSASAKGLTELIDVIKKYEVTAIFADVASSNVLASTLADEVGDIQVIDLYSESLGEQGSGASTYLGMIRSNAKLISEGLTDHDHDH